MRNKLLLGALMTGAVMLPCLAQTPDPAPATTDAATLERVRSHRDAAAQLGGTRWPEASHYFCTPGARFNAVSDPAVEPVKLFDQLYAVGDEGTVVYILRTRDGLVLIDSFYPEKLDSVLLPGMRKLGLDPAQVKLVLIAHGHIDHYGGAGYFQQTYGARVGVSAEDWALIEDYKQRDDRPPVKLPKRDLVLEDGKPVMLGGTSITPVATPGHTPGSMGFIFPVSDAGKRHEAAMYGSAMLTFSLPTVGQLDQYLATLSHWGVMTRKAGVDVEVQNHPLFDNMWPRVEALKSRARGGPHPFVVGASGYGQLFRVMSECIKAELAQRGAGS